jgi:aspartyl-tRNA(Asn)/glutamyl-tRNA(Gln) amidotransferase subunit A
MSRTATSDLASLPAHVLSGEIASRRLSPVDLVEALIQRIESTDGKLQAFIDTNFEPARLAAEGADKAIRAGHSVGPLHGIPVALKDLVELDGQVATGGSKAWRERRAARTATLATKMINAGMIVIGKTHTVEFALGGWGTNEHLGTPWNPWDLGTHRIPGGSSSGSGVAVAARQVPWAIGTDTGGSVRMPAAYCGITGLKTTIGRISTYGVLPLSPTLDTPGPITRSVEDAALLFDLLQGPDPRDPRTRGIAPSDPLSGLKRGIRGLRLARMPDAERAGVADEVLSAYDRSIEVLERLGAIIEPITLPCRFDDYAGVTFRIMVAEAYAHLGEVVENQSLTLDPAVRARVLSGAGISARDYLGALTAQAEAKQAFSAALAGFDALLTPTTETAAIPVADVDQSKAPARFTRFSNLLELCALAVPNGSTAGGLPTSLQIVCRGYDEATALRIGWAYEQATDWHRAAPLLGG